VRRDFVDPRQLSFLDSPCSEIGAVAGAEASSTDRAIGETAESPALEIQPPQRTEPRNGGVDPKLLAKRNQLTKQAPEKSDVLLIGLGDMPAYDDADRALVESALAALPAGKGLLTYSDVRDSFGISRATIVRKVRGGLVPGIRFVGSRVLEDGPVRRFTREQVRYLLLAARHRFVALPGK
jgi:hypothetical protein